MHIVSQFSRSCMKGQNTARPIPNFVALCLALSFLILDVSGSILGPEIGCLVSCFTCFL
jgi:hypothetical protein